MAIWLNSTGSTKVKKKKPVNTLQKNYIVCKVSIVTIHFFVYIKPIKL